MMSTGKQHFTTYRITVVSDIILIFLEVINNGKVKAPANMFMSCLVCVAYSHLKKLLLGMV